MSKFARFAAIAAAVVLLAASTIVILGLSLSPNLFKGQIAQVIYGTTGLSVTFDGDIKVRYFPWLGIELGKVTIMAPDDLGGGKLLKLDRAEVSVKLLPLLSKRVEAGAITLEGLEVNLVRDEKGQLNLPHPPIKDVRVEGDNVIVTTDDGQIYSLNYQIAKVAITGATLTFEDHMTKNDLRLANFNLNTGAVLRGKPFLVKLGFDYGVKNPDAAGHVDVSGQATAIPEALQFAFENASLKTTVAGKNLPVKSAEALYTGSIRVDLNKQVFTGQNLKFAAQAKGGLLPDAMASFNMGMNANVDMAAGTADLTAFSVEAMGFTATGEAHATNMPSATLIAANFSTNEFNPKEVLGKVGVGVQDLGTAKAQATIAVDMGKSVAEVSNVLVHALGLEIKAKGRVENIAGVPSMKASIALSEFNPRQVLGKLGIALPPMADASALTKARLNLNLEGAQKRLSVKTESSLLDSTTFSLDATVEDSAKPHIAFALKADTLDVDRYLPPHSATKETKTPHGKNGTEYLDVPVNATGTVDFGALKAGKLHFQKVFANLSVKDNQVELNHIQLSLYQGWAKGTAKADLRDQIPPVALNMALDGVQVEPLLTDLLGKPPLAGRATVTMVVTTKGFEPQQALANLSGKAAFALHNGAVLGFNLSPDTLQSKDALMTKGKGGGARTAYESIGGSYIIEKGVVSGNDFSASVPPHKATGQGWANLVTGALDYYIFARFLHLPAIPLHVTGSIYDPHVSVEPSMFFKDALQQGAKGTVNTIMKSPQNVLQIPQDAAKGALDAVGNFFGTTKKQ